MAVSSQCGGSPARPYPEDMARVLVIDDDATVAEVVLAYLERAGLDADHAVDGADRASARPRRPRRTSSSSTS